jgi:uncharacterized membrane protein
MRDRSILKLTLAAMFAALALICFSVFRIEIPLGGGLPAKIYVGSAFIMLSAWLLGSKYGGLTGAVGLTLGDLLAGYAASAPPTFAAKLIFGLACGFMAHQLLHLSQAHTKKSIYIRALSAGLLASLVNVATEPFIRWSFKIYILGFPEAVASISAINCAVAMAVNALPSAIIASLLYVLARTKITKDNNLLDI